MPSIRMEPPCWKMVITGKGWGCCGCGEVAQPLARGSGTVGRGGKKKKKHCRRGTGSDKGLFVTCRGEAREDAAAGHCLVPSRAAPVQKRGLKACLFAHTGES